MTGPAPGGRHGGEEHPSGFQVEIAHGELSAAIVEVGGALRALTRGAHPLIDGYGADEACSGARGHSLIPWPNRLRGGQYRFGDKDHQAPLTEPGLNNAIHGLVRWSNWTIDKRTSSSVVMAHVLHPQPGYPFCLDLRMAYSLDDTGLTVATTATNLGHSACPYGAGAHPYLRLGPADIDGLVLQAPGSAWMPNDDHQIPTGLEAVDGTKFDFRSPRPIEGTVLDVGYADLVRDADGLARVVLTDPNQGESVCLWMDGNYPYLMLFTGDTLPEEERRRRGLGAEPMTCAPNAFQSGDGLKILTPGESFTSTWGITAK
ncbi:MAG: aldose 1-epimerase family protein [Acidimicrobiales bacterium]